MVGVTYGIQPYGGSSMGWRSPFVVSTLAAGALLIGLFVLVEQRVIDPVFRLELLRIRAFTAGNIATALAAMARGGLQLTLIIWLQGIWLPEHGVAFDSTPFWAAICLLPLIFGFFVAGPLSGYLSDRYGVRLFTTGGMLLAIGSFTLLMALPIDFSYPSFAFVLFLDGVGMGLFSSPNRAGVMNSLPRAHRGVGGGMNLTFLNAASVLSIGVFFSLMIVGLSEGLPDALRTGLIARGVPVSVAAHVSQLPPVSTLFAAFLGDNPVRQLLGPHVLHRLPAPQRHELTGHTFFPHLVAGPFHHALGLAFGFAVVCCAVSAVASICRGPLYQTSDDDGTATREPLADPTPAG